MRRGLLLFSFGVLVMLAQSARAGGFGLVVAADSDSGTPFVAHGCVYVDVDEDGKPKALVTMNGPSNGAEVLSLRYYYGTREIGRARDHYLTQMTVFKNATVSLETKDFAFKEPGRYMMRFFYRDKQIAEMPLALEQIGEKDVFVNGKPAKQPLLREARGRKLVQAWLDMRSDLKSAAVIVHLAGRKDGKSTIKTVWKWGKTPKKKKKRRKRRKRPKVKMREVASEERIVQTRKGQVDRYVLRALTGDDRKVPDLDFDAEGVLAEEIGGGPDAAQEGLPWLDPEAIRQKPGLWSIDVRVDGKRRRFMEFEVNRRGDVMLVGKQKDGKIQSPFFMLKTKVIKP